MSYFDQLGAEPWRFDLFDVLRRIERQFQNRPRIGDSATSRDEFVRLGVDPYMDFPASNVSKAAKDALGRVHVHSKFLGLLGPQGALPYSTTEEAYGWWLMNDDAFPRFLDLLHNRFLQLFYRAWADSRPAVQHDRPDLDRFKVYLGSMIGLGSEPYAGLDSVPDSAKVAYAGIMMPQAKSASRLRDVLAGMFGMRVEIDEFVGSRLATPKEEMTRMGQRNCALGVDVMAGGNFFTIQDKFRVRIFVDTIEDYMRFLPTDGDAGWCEALTDVIYFYVGDDLDWDLELAIAVGAVKPTRVGGFGQLGWTTWMSPNWATTEGYRRDSRFHPAERIREKRRRQRAAQAA